MNIPKQTWKAKVFDFAIGAGTVLILGIVAAGLYHFMLTGEFMSAAPLFDK